MLLHSRVDRSSAISLPMIFVLAIVFGFVTFTSCARDIEPTVEGDVLEFSIKDLEGNVVTHEDERFDGKVVLIDIWGTWCPPCRQSIPKLVEWQEDYEDEGLIVVGVAFEESEDMDERIEALREFAEEYEINYLLLDGAEDGRPADVFPTLEGFQGYPTMVIIGRDGKVAHANTVFVPRENKKIHREIRSALGIE